MDKQKKLVGYLLTTLLVVGTAEKQWEAQRALWKAHPNGYEAEKNKATAKVKPAVRLNATHKQAAKPH